MSIRVVLADDQDMIRAGLRVLAERDGDIEVVAEAVDGHQAIGAVRRYRPDVVLMDIRMPRLDGIAATRTITNEPSLARSRIVMLTTFDEDEQVVDAIRAGAIGYLLKDLSPDELRASIRFAAAGKTLLSAEVSAVVLGSVVPAPGLKPHLLDPLTAREREVLREIGLGRSNDDIAAALFLSVATARTYVSRLLTKLDARDRATLVTIAYEAGLIVPGRPVPEGGSCAS